MSSVPHDLAAFLAAAKRRRESVDWLARFHKVRDDFVAHVRERCAGHFNGGGVNHYVTLDARAV